MDYGMGDKLKSLKRACLSGDEEPATKRVNFIDENDSSQDDSASNSDYNPSDHSSCSSAISCNLATISRDDADNDLTAIFWPSQNCWYQCSYKKDTTANVLTPAMSVAMSAAMSVHSGATNCQVLSKTRFVCSL